ncbi:MAG TPA: multicopper oxidase family protein [Gemmatimonadaceae bacterium]|nr:multicopper oxidase family protein [Gemmatimonadaceae bacterium]
MSPFFRAPRSSQDSARRSRLPLATWPSAARLLVLVVALMALSMLICAKFDRAGAHSVARATASPGTRCGPSHPAPDAPNGRVAAPAPDPDLYCIDLLPFPVTELDSAAGVARLAPPSSPFGIAVTPDGTHRYTVTVEVTGLPEPAALGPYRTWVAWATTPTLSPMIRLGAVAAGRPARGEVAFDKFLVIVSAEHSDTVTDRRGRIALRGMSASNRLLPVDDPVTLLGAAYPDADDHSGHAGDAPAPDAHAGHPVLAGGALTPIGSVSDWPMHPMDDRLFMPPGMMSLRPTVAPYLPRAGHGAPVAAARPGRSIRLTDGDTLRLEAGLVRRSIRGRMVTMLGYNGQYPGPLLDVHEGASIVVEFVNRLDQPSAVHWHGIRLDNRFDGVPHVTQEPVAPGDSFRYVVRFPDPGIYWYHPHQREDVQQALGLYGNIMVTSRDTSWLGPAHREEVLILDDLLLGDAGLVPFGAEAATHAVMGRFGNVMLVNGSPDLTLSARHGEVVRFFLTNAASTRTFNLSIPGARIKLLASDVGRYEREVWVESVVIAPAERYVVDAMFERTGTTALVNRVRAIDHMAGAFLARSDTLARITVSRERPVRDLAASFRRLREHPDVTREIERFRRHFGRPVDHELVLTMETRDLPFPVRAMMRDDSAYFHPVEWDNTMPMMNWVGTTREIDWILEERATGRRNMDVSWRFRVGDVVRLRLVNARAALHAMQHPIHIHGQRFLILARDGVPSENLVWKDTVLLPVGHSADLLVEMSNPGRWMLHCHIAEHMEAGMMMVFTVEP